MVISVIANDAPENTTYLENQNQITQHITVSRIPKPLKQLIPVAEKLLWELIIKSEVFNKQFQLVDMEKFEGYRFISAIDKNEKEKGKKPEFIWGMLTVGKNNDFELKKFDSKDELLSIFPEIADVDDSCIFADITGNFQITHYVINPESAVFGIFDTGLVPITDRAIPDRKKATLLADAAGFYDFSFWTDDQGDIEYLMGESFDNPQSVQNFTHIRHICTTEGAKVDIEKLLYLLDVSIVRLRRNTVWPFPTKYVNEYLRHEINLERAKKIGTI